MDNCLKDYVGLKHCSQGAPKSGLFINSLPGISTELVQAVSSKETDSFLELWDRMNSRAWERIQADVSKFMLSEKKINLSTIAYQTRRLRLEKPLTVLAANPNYVGVVINAPYAKYGKISIQTLNVYTTAAGTATVKVWDATTGEVLKTIVDQAFTLGYNAIDIDTEFGLTHDRLRLFIGVDATALPLYATRDYDYWWYESGSGCHQCWDGFWDDAYFELFPAQFAATDSFPLDLRRTGSGNGVSLTAELGCGVDTYLCENKRHFAVAWQHLVAAELMKEKLGSYKLNFFANTNLEMTAELRDSFTADYEKFLKLNINRIPVDGGQLCFNCEGVTGFVYGSLV